MSRSAPITIKSPEPPEQEDEQQNNQNNQQQQQQGEEEEASAAAAGFTDVEIADFREAFYHYFLNTSSRIPLTITAKELGYIFRAFGQQVRERDCENYVERWGSSCHELMGRNSNNNNNSGGGGIGGGDENNSDATPSPSTMNSRPISRVNSMVAGAGALAAAAAAGGGGGANSRPNTRATRSGGGSVAGGGGGGPQSTSSATTRPTTTQNQNNNNHHQQHFFQQQNQIMKKKVLSWEQFMALMQHKMRSEESVSAIEQAFDVFDPKRLGFIYSTDLRLYMTQLPGENRLSDEEVEAMILAADEDNSGSIEKDEFVAMLQ